MAEQWRKVDGFPDYSVSDRGRLRRDTAAKGTWAGRILSGKASVNGYLLFCMRVDGIPNMRLGHRLVARAFLGPPPTESHQVAHWDGDPLNNRVANLRWATCAENQRDRVRHGTSNRGERHGSARLSVDDVRAIRAEYASGEWYQREIGARYGVSISQVHAIVHRKRWAHLPD